MIDFVMVRLFLFCVLLLWVMYVFVLCYVFVLEILFGSAAFSFARIGLA